MLVPMGAHWPAVERRSALQAAASKDIYPLLPWKKLPVQVQVRVLHPPLFRFGSLCLSPSRAHRLSILVFVPRTFVGYLRYRSWE